MELLYPEPKSNLHQKNQISKAKDITPPAEPDDKKKELVNKAEKVMDRIGGSRGGKSILGGSNVVNVKGCTDGRDKDV